MRKIKQELQAHNQCEELSVELLSETDVEAYLSYRFPHSTLPQQLGPLLHQRTDGNALFMVNMVEHFIAQGKIVDHQGQWTFQSIQADSDVPGNLRQLIEKQLETLELATQRLLEVASVEGAEFSAAAVAAGLKQDIEAVEERCEELVGQRHFLEERGMAEWPDGTLSGIYGFQHALYQNVLYDRVAEARRVRLHRLLGTCLESSYGDRSAEVAAELAVHFEHGRETQKAITYHHQAGRTAISRSGYAEAIQHIDRALELLGSLPEAPEKLSQELQLRMTLAPVLIATKGQAAPEVESLFVRAYELCQQLGNPPQLFPVLFGHWGFHFLQAKSTEASQLAQDLLDLAQGQPIENGFLVEAHTAVAFSAFFHGDFQTARTQFEHSLSLYNVEQHGTLAFTYGQDPRAACGGFGAMNLAVLGYPDQALSQVQEALQHIEALLKRGFNVAYTTSIYAIVHQLRGEVQAAHQVVGRAIALCKEYDIPIYLGAMLILQGWSMAMQGNHEEGIIQIRYGLDVHAKTGAVLNRTHYFGLLAEAYHEAGDNQAGIHALDEAFSLVEATDERWYEAELHRIKGQLALQEKGRSKGAQKKHEAEAEECFQQALVIAQSQNAKLFELRAAVSLAQLWHEQGKTSEAQQLLSAVYTWFDEGLGAPDLKNARDLLAQLA